LNEETRQYKLKLSSSDNQNSEMNLTLQNLEKKYQVLLKQKENEIQGLNKRVEELIQDVIFEN